MIQDVMRKKKRYKGEKRWNWNEEKVRVNILKLSMSNGTLSYYLHTLLCHKHALNWYLMPKVAFTTSNNRLLGLTIQFACKLQQKRCTFEKTNAGLETCMYFVWKRKVCRNQCHLKPQKTHKTSCENISVKSRQIVHCMHPQTCAAHVLIGPFLAYFTRSCNSLCVDIPGVAVKDEMKTKYMYLMLNESMVSGCLKTLL